MVKIERVAVEQRDWGTITDGAPSSMVVGFHQSPETGKNRRPIFPDLDCFVCKCSPESVRLYWWYLCTLSLQPSIRYSMSKKCTGIFQMKSWTVNGEAGFLMRCQLFEKLDIFYNKLIAGLQRKHPGIF